MKKLGILIAMLFFAGTQFVMAQQQTSPPPPPPQQTNPVREYIQKDILPVVKQEHNKFINALTSSEKQELTKIQDEFKNLRPGPGMRGAYHPKMMNNRAKVQDLMDQAKKIADAHPKAADAYKEAIESKKVAWTKAIQEIREKNAMGYGRRRNAKKTPFIIERVSNPAFGLLFDGRNFPMHMRPGMRPGGRPGMGYGKYGHRGMYSHQMAMGMRGNYGRMGRGAGYMAMQNPEVKAKVLAYAKENIFPVVSKERKAFDKYLSGSEKRVIEKARLKLAEIHKEMLAKFHQGVRPFRGQPDSARLALRVQRDELMLPVKQIVLRHYGELETVVGKIRQDFLGWGRGMRMAVARDQSAGRGMGMGTRGYGMRSGRRSKGFNGRSSGMRHRGMGFFGPVKFLLYNPANPEASFPMMFQTRDMSEPASMK